MTRWPSVVLPAVVVGGATWAVVPFAVWWAGIPAPLVAGPWRTWGWGTAVVTGIALVVFILTRGRAPAWLLAAWRWATRRLSPGLWGGVAAAALAGLAIGMCLLLFSGNPRSVDGFAQLFHSRMLLAGRLWVEPPPEIANFAILHMVLEPGRWYSQYPMGQPAVLAAGLALGAWWVLTPLFCGVLVLAAYRVARWVADPTTARLTAILFVLCPFVVAVAGSELNHLPAAALGIGAAAAATALGGRRWPMAAAGAGTALGLLVAFRPLDAVAAAVPVGLIAVLSARRRIAALAAIGVAGAIATVPTLWLNRATTGAWTEFAYNRLWGGGVSLGFHEVPWGVPLTLRRAVALTGFDLHQLNMYLLDLPVPALLILAVAYVVGRRQLAVRDAVPLAAAGALLSLLFFYWHRDTFYGPRLLFGAVPWLLILFARAVVLLRRGWQRPISAVAGGEIAILWLSVAMAVGLGAIAPSRLGAYRASTPVLNLHPDRMAATEGIHHAVVVIPDGWGSRLIARMWGHGVPVPRSTGLYAAIDACTLELTLDRADRDPAAAATLLPELDALAARGRPGVRVRLTEDPNLRLPEDPALPPDCLAELAFDRRGLLAFAPFLYLNAAHLDGDVVWARDLRDRNAALFRRYAGRRLYRFAPAEPGGVPRFHPLDSRDGVADGR